MAYDRGLLEEVVLQQLWDLRSPLLRRDLLEPRRPSKQLLAALGSVFNLDGFDDVWTAKSCYIQCRAVNMRDVVMVSGPGGLSFGQVFFWARVGASVLACVSVWETLEWFPTFARCRVAENPQIVDASSVLGACIHLAADLGEVSQVLIPSGLRP